MKILCLLVVTIFLGSVSAETAFQREDMTKKNTKVLKSTKAYRKAKEECLKKSFDLKGKKLTDCIVDYQKEAK